MMLGYERPLYLLPFDHRHSYETGMFDFAPPLTPAQKQAVADSKRLIYEGFQASLDEVPVARAGILVDEEFGADILRDAAARGHVVALATEQSGSDEFELEYGDDFAAHIEAFRPSFAKVLVRYNPEGDAALNRRQVERLVRVSDHCRTAGPRFMFELLVPATQAQRAHVQATWRRTIASSAPA
jgi:myo-inositol catabolism protein IolC